ncbi:MAG: gamma-glutamyltransferase family protein, partial [Alphaproteobacteria bacterium]|nr:gamma-glutamyltransferase family protein [Alphaproteobacteria bacterium]
MFQTARSYGGMVTAPHHLAAQAGLRVLNDGGNAIEAMIAAAAAIAVVYPHMNALGGDNFWLVAEPGQDPVGIDACGGAAGQADIGFYKAQDHEKIPERGPLAALTVAGAVSGWEAAFRHSRDAWDGRLPLSRLLEDAIYHAEDGTAVTGTLARNTATKLDQLRDVPGFAETFLKDGNPYAEGERLVLDRLAATLDQLAHDGLHDFYRGDLARSIASDLEKLGSPLRLDDLQRHQALKVTPLSTEIQGHTLYNMPPPTQGLASLLLLAVFSRLNVKTVDDFAYVHALVESTKAAFSIRDRYVTDPAYMEVPAERFLDRLVIDELVSGVSMEKAAPWPPADPNGDTVWLGAVDAEGRAVSFIQSLYWEFGSGVVLPKTGIVWQNRGTSFSLDESHHNHLRPHRRPFHTIQPALATLKDGRVMAYGTMGGEGQPQTQAMVFSRHVLFDQPLQQAVTAPRWLLGKTWGEDSTSL